VVLPIQVKSVTTRSKDGRVQVLEADAVVFAIGITGQLFDLCCNACGVAFVWSSRWQLRDVCEKHTACAGMQKLVGASATLSSRPEFSAVQHLQSIDVISVRLATLFIFLPLSISNPFSSSLFLPRVC